MRFSTFNGGSILFAASLFNSINIYFIPISGSTPRQDTIQSQFEFALRYREKQSYESFLLALDSVRLFFENDPLYPVFESEVDNVKVEEAERIRRRRDADYFLEKMDKTRNDPRFGLSYAYAYSLKSKRISKNPVPHLQEYYNSLKTSKAERQSLASVLNLIADEEEDQGNDKVAIRHYESLIREYPDYYDIQYVKRRIGKLSFNKDSIVIPDQYIEIANSASPDKEEMRNTLLDIEEKITGGRNYEQKLKLVDSIIDGNKLKDKSRVLNNLFLFIKAGALSENNKFQESNELIDSFLPAVPVSNPLFLKSHLLKSKNFENMGSVSGSFDELRFYLENYDPALGVDLQEAEIEKSFRYYENKAAEHEKRGNLQEAALHYFFNTENMYLLKSKNLFLNSLYKTYAIYYQRKMVESIFQFGRKLAADESKGVLGTIGKGGSEVVSNVTNVLSSATDNKVFNNLKFLGDFKDLQNFNILGSDALKMIDLHFKQGLPRARPVLYLASLYGYAYYLINKSVIYENFYYENGAMTESRKSAILEDFKRAEYELRWIIFADPQFSDAYQLLGWLYQYIDIVKSAKSNPDGIPEGEYYAAAYLKYFPEKNFEINVEYYRQILDFLGESPNKKILSDLNLNLANNYFLLNNYPRAKDHYQATGKLSKFIVEKTQFENYKQAALYHFNFARTSIYIADYAKAIEELDIAAKIYYKNEYYPYLAKVGYDPENKSPFKQALLETKNKLALIFALSGLSAMESEQYSKSISFVNKALTMNKDSNYIENINLYNALAICHQKLGRYATSNYFAKKVEKEYSRKGKNFIQKFASFSIWNSLMPDSVRVIGEGRFPGSFPPEYHNLLSRGIRISNLRDENEFTLQSKAIVRREAFIKSNDLIQTNAGTRILNGTIPELAYVEYLKGNYPESQEKYYSAFEFFKKGGLPQEAKKYLIRSGNILFRGIEDQQEKTGNEIEKIKKYISILLREKSEIISECQVRAAADSKIPPDAFELNKSCEEQFFKDWYNFEPALGLSYYYLAEEYLSVNNREGATHYLGLSIPLLKNPSGIPDDLIGISGDVFSKKERIRLLTNLSIVFLQLNDAENFNKISADAADLALEFQQMEELSRIKYLQAKFI
ncbi:MAG: hypothetical protein K8R21_09720, partial [Leptospira sp.]|nr:hypothetical protein [Leptospira sp.]